jgi:hypothetical protein
VSSKGKPKHDLAPGPATTAVVEEAVAAGPPVAAAPGSGVIGSAPTAEGDQAAAPPAPEQPPTPPLPTNLDQSVGPLAPEHAPEEALGVLNGLVAKGVITKEEFDRIYLRELGPLGPPRRRPSDTGTRSTRGSTPTGRRPSSWRPRCWPRPRSRPASGPGTRWRTRTGPGPGRSNCGTSSTAWSEPSERSAPRPARRSRPLATSRTGSRRPSFAQGAGSSADANSPASSCASPRELDYHAQSGTRRVRSER